MFSPSPYASPAVNARRMAGLYSQVNLDSQVHGNGNPHKLIEMLYDGFFAELAKARGAMRAREIEAKCTAISKAIRIVEEGLRVALDPKAGGQIARDLNELYTFVSKRLVLANARNDEKMLDECAAVMRPLQEAWAAIRPGQGQPS